MNRSILSRRALVRAACRGLGGGIFALVLTGCSDQDFNFSQYPGFAEWYAANPPSSALPTAEQQALLATYQPRFYVSADGEGPIDFYQDYIAHGRLVDGDDTLISDQVDRALLNAKKADPAVVFTHEPEAKAPTPKVYGRHLSEMVDWPGCGGPIPLTFLTYHLVFRSSGLPAGVPGWQAAALDLLIDLDDWHQLDHYTAVTIALAPADEREPKPIAATFQQHNYLRTYVFGEEGRAGALALPEDGRIEVDIAKRSNELYPHQAEPAVWRAMSFMDLEGARYMVGDGEAPWLAADDMTDPAISIDPPLVFLQPNDAFYVFQGWLGERRHLPGRDGPPGADYNTLPPMKPLVHQMALSYWYEGDFEWLRLYETLFQNGRPSQIDATPFIEKIAKDLVECPQHMIPY